MRTGDTQRTRSNPGEPQSMGLGADPASVPHHALSAVDFKPSTWARKQSAVQTCKSLFFQHTFSGRRFPDNPGPMGKLERHIGRGFTRINTDQAGWAPAGRRGPILPVPFGQIPDVQHPISVLPRRSASRSLYLRLRRRRSCTKEISVQSVFQTSPIAPGLSGKWSPEKVR